MAVEVMINKSVVDALFKNCYPTGMECKVCGGNYVSLTEVEDGDGNTTEIHLNCSKCMNTFVNYILIDDTIENTTTIGKTKSCACGGNCGQ